MALRAKLKPAAPAQINPACLPPVSDHYGIHVSSGFNPTTVLTVDTETTGPNYWQGCRPFAVSLCDQNGFTAYVDWPVDPLTRQVSPSKESLAFLRELLSNPHLSKQFFNRKFDVRMLLGVGLETVEPSGDVYIAARVCNTEEPKFMRGPNGKNIKAGYKLKPLAWRYAKYPMEDETLLQKAVIKARNAARKLGWNLGQGTMWDYWLPKAVWPENGLCQQYAIGDVIRTLILFYLYKGQMEAEPDTLLRIYNEEMELQKPVEEMEARGISFSPQRNREQLQAMQERAQRELKLIREITGNPHFNPSAPAQVAAYLFDPKPEGLGLTPEPGHYTKTGQPKTGWKSLLPFGELQFVRSVSSYKMAVKGISAYFRKFERLALPDHLNPKRKCLYANVNQNDARTGRTTSGGEGFMAFQTISNPETSVRGENVIPARVPFGPRPGYVWACLDYSSQEFAIYACIANIPSMKEALLNGEDLHAANAERAWGGRGNEHAVKKAVLSLELGNPYCDRAEVLKVWHEMEWNSTLAGKLGGSSPEALQRAERWLSLFGYSIVKAEKSIGSKRARSTAKSVGYARIYGGGPPAVQAFLMCSRAEAEENLNRFDELFPGMVAFNNKVISEVYKNGYIVTPYGRRINVDPYFAYKGINYYVQGSGADMMKRAIRQLYKYLIGLQALNGLDAHLLLPVHDELVFEIKASHAHKWLLRSIRAIMMRANIFEVPIEVGCDMVRRSWAEKEKVEL